jgi:hypothetical protein
MNRLLSELLNIIVGAVAILISVCVLVIGSIYDIQFVGGRLPDSFGPCLVFPYIGLICGIVFIFVGVFTAWNYGHKIRVAIRGGKQ